MKNITSLFLAVILVIPAFAASSGDMETEEFTVDGIKVILKPSVKETISARFFVRGGVLNYEKEHQGIESLAYNLAMTGGAESISKDEFNARSEKIGTSFNSGASLDYGHMSMNCLKMYFDESWDLFTAAITNPAMPQAQFDIILQQQKSQVKQSKSNPDSHLSDLARQKSFTGSKYELDPAGTEESLENISLEDVRNYYKKHVVKERGFLVVVGNIEKAELESMISGSLSKLPAGEPMAMDTDDIDIEESVYVENRDIETNYITGVMNAPLRSAEDYIANQLAMSLLYDRYFEELRTKRSLSYAPAAYHSSSARYPSNRIYITTTDPAQSMDVMIAEIDSVKRDGFSKEELKGKKLKFLTSHFMGQETNANISMALGVNEVSGSWKWADQFDERVESTQLEDVNAAFNKYTEDISWIYLGKEDMVQPDDFKQPMKGKKLKK